MKSAKVVYLPFLSYLMYTHFIPSGQSSTSGSQTLVLLLASHNSSKSTQDHHHCHALHVECCYYCMVKLCLLCRCRKLSLITNACLVAQSCPTLCDPMDYSPPGSSVHGDSPGKNTGVGCHALLQGIFPTQGWNSGFLYCRQILNRVRHQGIHIEESNCNRMFCSIKVTQNHFREFCVEGASEKLNDGQGHNDK